MVERKEYLDQLWAWKDERQIKVVTGIRRCGKSVLLEQYQQRLLANGVTPEQIISINFENLDYEPFTSLYVPYLPNRCCHQFQKHSHAANHLRNHKNHKSSDQHLKCFHPLRLLHQE